MIWCLTQADDLKVISYRLVYINRIIVTVQNIGTNYLTADVWMIDGKKWVCTVTRQNVPAGGTKLYGFSHPWI